MNISITYRKNRRRIKLFLFFLFCNLLFKAQISQFDINDPRNPNCPCHKYQKIADEEYAQLIRTKNKGNGEFIGKANSREDHIKTYRTNKYRKIKRKLKDKSHRKSKWIYEFKNWDVWRRVTNPISCPVWNG